MQLLSPTKSEEITAVSPSFCDLFTFKALGKKKKKAGSLSVDSLVIPKVNNTWLTWVRDSNDMQKGQKLSFFPRLRYANGKCNFHSILFLLLFV